MESRTPRHTASPRTQVLRDCANMIHLLAYCPVALDPGQLTAAIALVLVLGVMALAVDCRCVTHSPCLRASAQTRSLAR